MLLKDWKIRKAELNDLNYFHQALEQIYLNTIDIKIFSDQFKKIIKV